VNLMIQKKDTMSGLLYIVSTPIGNLDDFTYRAVEVLTKVDLVVAENPARSRRLLFHYGIKSPMISYNKDNESSKTGQLIQKLEAGIKVAMLVSAGTPSISDPGFLLVREALSRDIEPVIIPGVSALTYAVVACGLPVTNFSFAGFLTKKKRKRRILLNHLAAGNDTFFLFESPNRIHQLLMEVVDELGSDAYVVLIREATKLYEEHIRGTAKELLDHIDQIKLKGEFTVAITTKKGKHLESSEGE
jgi:16S rRNA (cytidine1402-2'-O)-methyltransferase